MSLNCETPWIKYQKDQTLNLQWSQLPLKENLATFHVKHSQILILKAFLMEPWATRIEVVVWVLRRQSCGSYFKMVRVQSDERLSLANKPFYLLKADMWTWHMTAPILFIKLCLPCGFRAVWSKIITSWPSSSQILSNLTNHDHSNKSIQYKRLNQTCCDHMNIWWMWFSAPGYDHVIRLDCRVVPVVDRNISFSGFCSARKKAIVH